DPQVAVAVVGIRDGQGDARLTQDVAVVVARPGVGHPDDPGRPVPQEPHRVHLWCAVRTHRRVVGEQRPFEQVGVCVRWLHGPPYEGEASLAPTTSRMDLTASSGPVRGTVTWR